MKKSQTFFAQLQKLSTEKKDQLFRVLLSIMLVGSFLLKLYHLEFPKEHYFDEVYHAFTAQHYLHQDRTAYDIWATPPEGFAYEWVHPPLAKLAMAGFMALVGENSFGWRLGSVIFGTGVIAMTALLALTLFRSRKIALFAAFFLCTDGLMFAQSRIAMNDEYFLFFGLCSIYAYLHWRNGKQLFRHLFLSGFFFGLALASKWTSIYIFLLYCTDLAILLTRKFMQNYFNAAVRVEKQKVLRSIQIILQGILSFGIIPAILYLGSYGQFFSMGYSWKEFVEMQQQIWWYHTGLRATHPYQSTPLEWIFDMRPVWYWTGSSTANVVKNIYNLGNPFFFWFGLLAVVFTALQVKKQKNSILWFCLLWYFWMWLPWAKSPRIMFFYHYLPALPALAILSGHLVNNLLNIKTPAKQKSMEKTFNKMARLSPILLFTLCIGWFILFYPNLSGAPVPKGFADSVFFIFPRWK